MEIRSKEALVCLNKKWKTHVGSAGLFRHYMLIDYGFTYKFSGLNDMYLACSVFDEQKFSLFLLGG